MCTLGPNVSSVTTKGVQNISLIIIDELHMIGGENGPTIDHSVTHPSWKHILKKLELLGCRLLLKLAMSEIGWVQSKINMHLVQRTAYLMHLKVVGFNENRFGAQVVAMSKPCYNTIATTLKPKVDSS